MSFVYVGMGFMAFLSATTLAIDVGMFMTARSQAQNSADGGALAGATALAFDSFTDRTPTGPAVVGAISTAQANQVIGATVSVTPPDVTFPNDPNGFATRVKVDVYRTAARGNPVPTLMGSLFGVTQADIVATATAEASPANAETCVKPFTIPDRWWSAAEGGPSMPDDSYTPDAGDYYIGPADPAKYTGYNPDRDRGLQLTLKANNTNKVTASFYNPYDLPGSVGANDYRNNIDQCNTAMMHPGDDVPPENGNMVGPTRQGTDDLTALDPNAYWDGNRQCVMGSQFAPPNTCAVTSPRIAIIPVYDPNVFLAGPAHGKNIDLQITNFIGIFIEPLKGNGEVTGRIMPIPGFIDKNAGPAPPGAFPKVIRLVQ